MQKRCGLGTLLLLLLLHPKLKVGLRLARCRVVLMTFLTFDKQQQLEWERSHSVQLCLLVKVPLVNFKVKIQFKHRLPVWFIERAALEHPKLKVGAAGAMQTSVWSTYLDF
jgi:hypothetical protein